MQVNILVPDTWLVLNCETHVCRVIHGSFLLYKDWNFQTRYDNRHIWSFVLSRTNWRIANNKLAAIQRRLAM